MYNHYEKCKINDILMRVLGERNFRKLRKKINSISFVFINIDRQKKKT